MTPPFSNYQHELSKLCVIVPNGQGSRVLRIARDAGINGGTVLLGRGSRHHAVLSLLGLSDSRKEVVWMVAGRATCHHAMGEIAQQLQLHKANHGIAFMMRVRYVAGIHRDISLDYSAEDAAAEGETKMYQLITVIVEKGRAPEVIESATRAGSGGGTILNARGSGIHETSRVFAMDIEPEKEVVMILSQRGSTAAITNQVREDLEIDKPGHGIIFVQDVDRAVGLHEQGNEG